MREVPQKRPAFEPAARLVQAERGAPDMRRPGSTLAGGLLVLLRVLVGIVYIVVVALDGTAFLASIDIGGELSLTDLPPEAEQFVVVVVLVVLAVPLFTDAVLAVLILRGWNRPRVFVMFVSVLSICTAFAFWWVTGKEVRFVSTLLPVAFDVLILLALSSRSAAAYARRRQRHPGSAEE